MVEMEDMDVEKTKGGENVEKEAKEAPVWYLYEGVNLGEKEETVLAQNGIDYAHHPKVTNGNEVNYKIPVYPEDIKKYSEYLYVHGNKVYLYSMGEKTYVRYHKDWKTGQIYFNPQGYADTEKVPIPEGLCVECCNDSVKLNYSCLDNLIRSAIREKKDIITDEEAKAVLIKMIQRYDDFVKKLPELKEQLKKKIQQDFEKEYREREEKEQKRKAAEEAEKKKKMDALLSKNWVKQLKEKMDISDKRQMEIERFKSKYGLVDEELQISETNDEPYVHITTKIDLRPIGINRTLYIRNYLPDQFANVDEVDKEVFSDYSQEVASKLAEILDHEVVVFDDREDDDYRYNAYLVLVDKENHDNIEVASTEIEDDY